MKHSEIPAVIASVRRYKEQVTKVLQGEEELKNIKAVMSGMGVYQQRVKGTFMLRVRIPAGVLKREWLRSIYEIGKKVEIPRFHLTSRQDIQYHGLSLAQTIEVMEALLEQGLVTTGGGGDNPRNIACSPYSGIEEGEIFDVTPYALGCCDYIMKIIDTFHLPRKYKIAFANTVEDTTNASATDLGFIAKIQEGERGFKVFVGGGLGKNPKPGIVFSEFVKPEEVLYIVQGLKELFEALGDYSNRNIARIRYIVERLGEENFKETLYKYINEVKKKSDLQLNRHEVTHYKEGNEVVFKEKNIFAQKQRGLYAVKINPFGGYLSLEELGKLMNLVEHIPDCQLRLTMEQTLLFTDLTGVEVEKVLIETKDIGVKGIMEKIVACTGSNTCQIGLAPSEELIALIKEKFNKVPAAAYKALPEIHISGCQNSCTAQQLATIGFSGGKKRIGDAIQNVYTLSINGSKGSGETKLGEVVGTLLMEDVPELLIQLGKSLTEGQVELNKEEILKHYQALWLMA